MSSTIADPGRIKTTLEVFNGNTLRCWGTWSLWGFTVTEQDFLSMNPNQKKVGASNDQFTPSTEFPIYPAVKVTVNPWGCFWPSLIMPRGTYMLWKLNHNSLRRKGKLVKQTFLSLSSFSQIRKQFKIWGLHYFLCTDSRETGLELIKQVYCQIGRLFKSLAYKNDFSCRFWQLKTMTMAWYKSSATYSFCF